MKWNNIFTLIVTICLMQSASGQNTDKKSDKMITITGKVFNMDHKPVEGADFYIDNVKITTKSKSNGSYKIKISPNSLNLEVRSSEYGSSKILINNQTTINFTLTGIADYQTLEPGNMENWEVGSDSIKIPVRQKTKKMNTYSDIYQMIRTEVAGVRVSGRSIQIQQGHSFFGSGNVLLVVNGIMVTSIDHINPVEVKTIQVLKGSAAAIYGVNGSNGVLMITLLNGSEK